MSNFVTDCLDSPASRTFKIKRTIKETITKTGQLVAIHDLEGYGRTLFINGERQSSEADERAYHECLVHPAMVRSPIFSTPRVAILGGGEGAVLREVMKHDVESVLWLDYDEELCDLCYRYLPQHADRQAEYLAMPHVDFRQGDVLTFLDEQIAVQQEEDEPGQFEVVIYDMPEYDENTIDLYWPKVFVKLSEIITDDGVLALQAGPAHPTRCEALLPVIEHLHTAFEHVQLLILAETSWVFVVASHMYPDTNELLQKELLKRDDLFWYNAGTDSLLGVVPTWLDKAIKVKMGEED
ncbi:MAG: hypothetical protein OEX12_01320 [Gammaproteobacteria bacterium]|nr:hypothetical protein [Gammaproteobacteria bacterium]